MEHWSTLTTIILEAAIMRRFIKFWKIVPSYPEQTFLGSSFYYKHFHGDVLRDLVPFEKFKKREKHPWRSVTFYACFSRFLNCSNGTKSRKASRYGATITSILMYFCTAYKWVIVFTSINSLKIFMGNWVWIINPWVMIIIFSHHNKHVKKQSSRGVL